MPVLEKIVDASDLHVSTERHSSFFFSLPVGVNSGLRRRELLLIVGNVAGVSKLI